MILRASCGFRDPTKFLSKMRSRFLLPTLALRLYQAMESTPTTPEGIWYVAYGAYLHRKPLPSSTEFQKLTSLCSSEATCRSTRWHA